MDNKLKELIPVEKLYNDLAQPSVQEVGDVLHNTVKVARFLFAPIDYLATQQDRFQNYLKRIGEKIKEENLIETSPRMVGEVFEALKYSEEQSILTELFLNLLAKAIDKTTQDKCHPAFPNIIKQLSPDEAVILFYLKSQSYELKQHSNFDSEKMLFTSSSIEYNRFPLKTLKNPNNFFIYMNHLNSLNLAGIWQQGNQVPTGSNGKQDGVDIFSKIMLSEFGELFAESVIPSDINKFCDVVPLSSK